MTLDFARCSPYTLVEHLLNEMRASLAHAFLYAVQEAPCWTSPSRSCIAPRRVSMSSIASNGVVRRHVLPAMGYFVVAYILVNILATAFGFAVSMALGISTNAEPGSRASDPG